MVDSKFTEHAQSNTETGFPKHDTQLSASAPANKTTILRDLQNANQNMVPKYVGSSPFPTETGSIKVSGTKRPTPECPVSSPHQQSPTNTAVNGRLVYVRRKPEAELGKSSTSGNTSNNTECPQPRKLGDQSDRILQQPQMKDSRVSMPEPVPVWRASSVGVSSGKPSVPLLPGKFNNNLQPADSDCRKATSAITSLEYPKKTSTLHWEERFCRLQNLLKILDQSVHGGYVQSMLLSFE